MRAAAAWRRFPICIVAIIAIGEDWIADRRISGTAESHSVGRDVFPIERVNVVDPSPDIYGTIASPYPVHFSFSKHSLKPFVLTAICGRSEEYFLRFWDRRRRDEGVFVPSLDNIHLTPVHNAVGGRCTRILDRPGASRHPARPLEWGAIDKLFGGGMDVSGQRVMRNGVKLASIHEGYTVEKDIRSKLALGGEAHRQDGEQNCSSGNCGEEQGKAGNQHGLPSDFRLPIRSSCSPKLDKTIVVVLTLVAALSFFVGGLLTFFRRSLPAVAGAVILFLLGWACLLSGSNILWTGSDCEQAQHIDDGRQDNA